VYDATLTVAAIIRERRPMPQKGKYRIARLHAKLLPEFTALDARREDIIKAYDHHEMVSGPKTKDDPLGQNEVLAEEFSVPADKLTEFSKAWAEITDEEIDVDVEPVPLDQLSFEGVDGSIHANELIALGDLVKE
jgi:hypothetical protein